MAKFDPYRIWLGIPPEEQPPNHYRLLGVGLFETNPDVISNAADRQMVHLRALRSGKHGELSQRILNEVAAARVCLLDTQKKGDYDALLRRQLATTRTGPPPPRATPPPPPSTKSGPEAPPPPAVPPVQAGPDRFSGATRSSGYGARRKRATWHGPAITVVLVGATLVLLAWAFGDSTSEPAVQRRGNGKSHVRSPKPSRYRPNPTRQRPGKRLSGTPGNSDGGLWEATPSAKTVVGGSIADGVASHNPSAVVRPWEPPDSGASLGTTPGSGADSQDQTPRDQDTKPGRREVPDAESLSQAEDLVKNVFQKDFAAANQPAGKAALARKLLAEGRNPQDKPTASYALLRLAKAYASEAGDAETAVAAVDEIAARYAIDPLDTKIETLQAVSEFSTTSTTRQRLARKVFVVLEEALASDDFDAADRLLQIADAAVKRAPGVELRKLAAMRTKQVAELRQRYQTVQQALKVLDDRPDDPQASETVGTYYALLKGDWKRGLPKLATAAETDLKKLAQSDLADPAITDQRLALADGWWDAAEKRDGKEKEHLQQRAARWYKLVEPSLTGISLTNARNRLLAAGDPDVKIDPSALPKFTGLECRGQGIRPMMLRAYGGNAASEAAVDRALKWLASLQGNNESWSFVHTGSRPKDKYLNPGELQNAHNAATALALLPFLGAGHGPKQGEYRSEVNKGLTFLKKRMARAAQFGGVATLYEPDAGQMPSHALGTIALCEAWSLGADTNTRKAAQVAVDVILNTQNPDGGWSSKPSPPEPSPGLSGMDPTGWNLVALKTAQWAGLKVPDKTLQEAGRFIAGLRSADQTGYRRSVNIVKQDPTATAVAMLAQMHLGRPRDDNELVGYVAELGKTGPVAAKGQSAGGRLYLNYFNASVMRESGDPAWQSFNVTLRDHLLGTQQTDGDLAGSWILAGAEWSTTNGGRLFCTAVAALILEVYYRHPPLYP